tara:strand:+ start:2538 stop:3317 length:780 start_codon:yes stop_codon:yes gene_type:complete
MATSLDGGDATTTGAPTVSGGADPVNVTDIAPVSDPHSVAGDYHFIEGDLPVEAITHFGGHPMFLNIPSWIAVDNSLVYADTETDRHVVGSVINTDISAYLPAGLSTPNAAIVMSTVTIATTEPKIDLNTVITGYVYYSLVYNSSALISPSLDGGDATTTGSAIDGGNADGSGSVIDGGRSKTGSTLHIMNQFSLGSQSNAADDVAIKGRVSSQAIVPVVYSGGVPYITWFSRLAAEDMSSDAGLYGIANYLYLVGLLK